MSWYAGKEGCDWFSAVVPTYRAEELWSMKSAIRFQRSAQTYKYFYAVADMFDLVYNVICGPTTNQPVFRAWSLE